uniref:Uncharacterized protein n=2 Tax=Oryza TaxID=4527 RepID=Q6ERX2_ORYSJ|nr:hypothetical protein [Oryza sativa Japonica Group]BAD28598.1 hypothetical protein [Oryza sativa Japonica Group]
MVSATAVKIAAIFMVALTIGQLMAEASSSSSPQPRRLLEVDDDDDGEVVEAELDEATLLADELATIVQGCRSICHRHPKSWRHDGRVIGRPGGGVNWRHHHQATAIPEESTYRTPPHIPPPPADRRQLGILSATGGARGECKGTQLQVPPRRLYQPLPLRLFSHLPLPRLISSSAAKSTREDGIVVIVAGVLPVAAMAGWPLGGGCSPRCLRTSCTPRGTNRAHRGTICRRLHGVVDSGHEAGDDEAGLAGAADDGDLLVAEGGDARVRQPPERGGTGHVDKVVVGFDAPVELIVGVQDAEEGYIVVRADDSGIDSEPVGLAAGGR